MTGTQPVTGEKPNLQYIHYLILSSQIYARSSCQPTGLTLGKLTISEEDVINMKKGRMAGFWG
jgi:hypothetical protein